MYKNNKALLFLLFSIIGIGIGSALLLEKGVFLRELNSFQSSFLDYFLNIITYLGDGRIIIGVSLVLLALKKYKIALWNLICYLASGILVQIPKRIFQLPRPKKLLIDFEQLAHPIWVEFKAHNSFPSGHTTSAFAMLVFFAILIDNKLLKFTFILLAFLVAVSRVYLLQHFLIDVTVGAFIGSFTVVILYYFFIKNSLS